MYTNKSYSLPLLDNDKQQDSYKIRHEKSLKVTILLMFIYILDHCVGKPCDTAGTCRFNEVTLDCRCIGGLEFNGIFECVGE